MASWHSEAMAETSEPNRTKTRSVETSAAVATVVELLADPERLPEWAPAFADSVIRDASSGWQATKDGRSFALRSVVDEAAGTADYLREVAPGREGGAYVRAVPRPGGGTVVVMTVPLPPGADPADTEATLVAELRALVSLAKEH